jgi:hypothetical protein
MKELRQMCKSLTILILFIGLRLAQCQTSPVLTNETVFRMVAAGVPEDVIIRTIAAADHVAFSFLPNDLQMFADNKVPDDVFKAMAAKSKGGSTPGASAGPAQAQGALPPVAQGQSQLSCIHFTVVTRDKLNNLKQGLSTDDVKWFQKAFAKKFPGVCYVDPAPTVPVVFYITVTPDVYHGTRIVRDTSTHTDPVNATVTDQNGNSSQVNGTVETTTTSSTAVPYSLDYGIFTLSVERRLSDGKLEVTHTFQQKGLYRTLYGIPLGGRGHHPLHAVLTDAVKWLGDGGLSDPRQAVVEPVSHP